MQGEDQQQALEILARWLSDEMKKFATSDLAKKQDAKQWKGLINPDYAPIQTDGVSCGIFVLYSVYFLELGRRMNFTQADVPRLRRRNLAFLFRNKLAD